APNFGRGIDRSVFESSHGSRGEMNSRALLYERSFTRVSTNKERKLMRAILRKHFGGPDVLEIREIPEPEPKVGHAVIEVKAFGINHAEKHMREGEWAEIADVSGIECVGVVKSCPGGEFSIGAKVAALMGGLGRTINGSYAEYTRAPVTNIATLD